MSQKLWIWYLPTVAHYVPFHCTLRTCWFHMFKMSFTSLSSHTQQNYINGPTRPKKEWANIQVYVYQTFYLCCPNPLWASWLKQQYFILSALSPPPPMGLLIQQNQCIRLSGLSWLIVNVYIITAISIMTPYGPFFIIQFKQRTVT